MAKRMKDERKLEELLTELRLEAEPVPQICTGR